MDIFYNFYKKNNLIKKNKINENVGYGYFAKKDIDKNTIIFTEKIKINYNKIINNNDFIDKLNKKEQELFLTFMPYKGDLIKKYICNAFSINGNKNNTCILFESRFFNHSCIPNVYFIFNLTKNEIQFISNRKILQNEELTISYINNPNNYTLLERRSHLYYQYNFFCNCDKCIDEYNHI